MFQVNDYVICGGSGVCEVQDICSNPFDQTKPEEKYYLLKPVYLRENTVYIPVHHPKIAMRKLISKEEAKKLIRNIPLWERFGLKTISKENYSLKIFYKS